jgi:hypothetical protein
MTDKRRRPPLIFGELLARERRGDELEELPTDEAIVFLGMKDAFEALQQKRETFDPEIYETIENVFLQTRIVGFPGRDADEDEVRDDKDRIVDAAREYWRSRKEQIRSERGVKRINTKERHRIAEEIRCKWPGRFKDTPPSAIFDLMDRNLPV